MLVLGVQVNSDIDVFLCYPCRCVGEGGCGWQTMVRGGCRDEAKGGGEGGQWGVRGF